MKKTLLLWWPCFVFSAETVLNMEQSAPDRAKAVQAGIEQLSMNMMEQFIEPSKLKAQKKQIQKIISTYSNRYILYTKTGTPVKKGPQSFVLPVTIGFSEENFKKILLAEDLFYSGSSHLRILPLILFENKVQKASYGWWRKQKEPPSARRQEMSLFYSHIQNAFLPYHFFVIHPEFSASRYFVPKAVLSKRLSEKKKFQLARILRSHLIMTGSITLKESDVESILNMKVHLAVHNVDSGRLLAEVERFEKIPIEPDTKKTTDIIDRFLKKDTGFAKSLGSQLQLIYEEGRLSSHALQITLQGPLLSKDLKHFQKQLKTHVPSITNLQEHIISQRALTYIVSADLNAEEVMTQIKSAQWDGFDVQVVRVKKNNIILKVSLKN